jgi:hypothetical protein
MIYIEKEDTTNVDSMICDMRRTLSLDKPEHCFDFTHICLFPAEVGVCSQTSLMAKPAKSKRQTERRFNQSKPWENHREMEVYPLVMINITMEHDHRNSEFSHEQW